MRETEAGNSWHPQGRKRGRVSGFSGDSRRRLMELQNSLPDTLPLPLFVTLTYPAEWADNPTAWKRDLYAFRRALERKAGKVMVIWKMEPQERGAPHFHLAAYTSEWLEPAWLSKTWYRIVGSNDPKHLAAGTQVQRARSRQGAMAYIGKYLGKQVSLKAGWEAVGRYWGVWNRPATLLKRVWLPARSAYAVRRILWGFRAARNRRRKRTPYRGREQGASGFIRGPTVARIIAAVL